MNTKTKTYIVAAIAIIVAFGAFVGYRGQNKATDLSTATYTIEGMQAKYFGNAATGDLNGDGRDDVAFLLTASGGGSGTFYYAMVALKTATGSYQMTNPVIIGDRIAPQTTEIRDGQLIVNYADRKLGEPMVAQPSVGVSKYFSVSGTTLTSRLR